MTIQKCIERFETVNGHQYPQEMLIEWLNDLDRQIYRDYICWHEVTGIEEPEPYSEEALQTTLLVPEPYTDIYIKYLCMQVNFYNNEIGRYNNSVLAFTKALDNYSAFLNRKYLPRQDVYVRI